MANVSQVYNDTTKDLLFAILTALGGSMIDVKGIYHDSRDDLLYAILERLEGAAGLVKKVAVFKVEATNEERSVGNYPGITGANGVLINIGSQFIDTSITDNRYALPDLETGNIDFPPLYQDEIVIILKY
jgi:hypothetical protein